MPKKLALAVAVVLFLLMGPAAAGGRVDWSEYIDPNPSKPVRVEPAKLAKNEAPARGKKASKAKKKVGKAGGKATKAKARKKKGRR